MCLLLLFLAFFTPFEVAFLNPRPVSVSFGINRFSDVVFVMDIYLNLHTACPRPGVNRTHSLLCALPMRLFHRQWLQRLCLQHQPTHLPPRPPRPQSARPTVLDATSGCRMGAVILWHEKYHSMAGICLLLTSAEQLSRLKNQYMKFGWIVFADKANGVRRGGHRAALREELAVRD